MKREEKQRDRGIVAFDASVESKERLRVIAFKARKKPSAIMREVLDDALPGLENRYGIGPEQRASA